MNLFARLAGAPLTALLEASQRFLDETSASDFIRSIAPKALAPATIRDLIADIDHVGFIAPVRTELAAIFPAAAACGFDVDPKSFASIVVANELHQMRGKPVPTTIFTAYRASLDGVYRGVELFLPEDDDGVVAGWIADGVANHVALALNDAPSFREVTRFLQEAGFHVPAFKREAPLTTIPQPDGRQFLTVYLDRNAADMRLRIELCCYVDRVTPSIIPEH